MAVETAKRTLLTSKDSESAAVISVTLILYGGGKIKSEAGHERLRRLHERAAAIFRQLSAASTKPILNSLQNSENKDLRELAAKLQAR